MTPCHRHPDSMTPADSMMPLTQWCCWLNDTPVSLTHNLKDTPVSQRPKPTNNFRLMTPLNPWHTWPRNNPLLNAPPPLPQSMTPLIRGHPRFREISTPWHPWFNDTNDTSDSMSPLHLMYRHTGLIETPWCTDIPDSQTPLDLQKPWAHGHTGHRQPWINYVPDSLTSLTQSHPWFNKITLSQTSRSETHVTDTPGPKVSQIKNYSYDSMRPWIIATLDSVTPLTQLHHKSGTHASWHPWINDILDSKAHLTQSHPCLSESWIHRYNCHTDTLGSPTLWTHRHPCSMMPVTQEQIGSLTLYFFSVMLGCLQ